MHNIISLCLSVPRCHVLSPQVLDYAGPRLSVTSFNPALDHLLHEMSQMVSDFDRSVTEADVDNFIVRTQVLRAVGAPGMGKSTFVTSAWSLLHKRLVEVERDGSEMWQQLQSLGAKNLKQRLESWSTEFGSLVFMIDMSDQCEL